jgi:hypothetical protein
MASVEELKNNMADYRTAPVMDWAEAIEGRLVTELNYESDVNNLIARIVKEAIINNPALLNELVGTFLIEDSYFESI